VRTKINSDPPRQAVKKKREMTFGVNEMQGCS